MLLHETIREYGLEMLAEQQELEAARAAHAAYYLRWMQDAHDLMWGGGEEERYMKRVEREYANLRAALEWLLSRHESEQAMRLSTNLFDFWNSGHRSEGRRYLERALASSQEVPVAVRAGALLVAAWLAVDEGDLKRASALGREAALLQPELKGTPLYALSFLHLGRIAWATGDFTAAAAYAEEGLAVARATQDGFSPPWLLDLLGQVAFEQGEDSRARELLEEGLALHRANENLYGVVNALLSLIRVLFAQGDLARARVCAEEQLALSRRIGFPPGIASALIALGCFMLREGNGALAGEQFEEGMALLRDVQDTGSITTSLQSIGIAVAAQGQLVEAAQLWGAAEGLGAEQGTSLPPTERAMAARTVTTARAALGEEAFARAWHEGRALTPEQAVAALRHTLLSSHAPVQTPRRASGIHHQMPVPSETPDLTEREVEVVRLVAQGLTDAQVAEALVISPRTVNAHLRSIYGKLNMSSRHALTRFAIAEHLI